MGFDSSNCIFSSLCLGLAQEPMAGEPGVMEPGVMEPPDAAADVMEPDAAAMEPAARGHMAGWLRLQPSSTIR